MSTNRLHDGTSIGETGRKHKYFDVASRTEMNPMLQIETMKGNYHAFPYMVMSEIFMDGFGKIQMKMGEYMITIKGRRLQKLFDHLCNYRVKQIRPASHEFEDLEPEIESEEISDETMKGKWVDKVSPDKANLTNSDKMDFIEFIEVLRVD